MVERQHLGELRLSLGVLHAVRPESDYRVHIAHVFKPHDLLEAKLDLKLRLDSQDELDVIQRILLGDVFRRRRLGDDDARIVEQANEDLIHFGKDLLGGHGRWDPHERSRARRTKADRSIFPFAFSGKAARLTVLTGIM